MFLLLQIGDKWGRALALNARAGCYRRNRDFDDAIRDCDEALALFPRYSRALFRKAMSLLESRRPAVALHVLEQLLRVDRKWPKLLDLLIRATAQMKRQEQAGAASSSGSSDWDTPVDESSTRDDAAPVEVTGDDYYTALGVPVDATEAQLKRAYRLMSLKYHPDRAGGSTAAFQYIRAAYDTLSDAEKRQAYDDGADVRKRRDDSEDEDSEDEDNPKKKSLREEVERKYFPENFKYWPFGDPFIEKRRHDARKQKTANNKAKRSAWEDY